jgi:sphingomyelin phosphodiesterase acid-like 3
MRVIWLGRRVLGCVVVAAACAVAAGDLMAQSAGGAASKTVGTAAAPVDAVMMSDIHFDPFRDPAKAQRLVDAPEGEWNKILGDVDSPDQKQAYANLQTTCHETSDDSSYALLQSSLAQMKLEAPEAKFATVSGDLIVHSLPCRFKQLVPGKTESDYKAFVEKTDRYVIDQVRLSLGGMPVYVALGNIDTECEADYSIETGDPFLGATKDAALGWLPAGAEKNAALASYAETGSYSVMMAKPMQRTRLIVLDDLFQSRRYKGCSGQSNQAAIDGQLGWLEKELAGAKRRGERVWVMGHIPPGIDSYATITQQKNVCKGDQPVTFLSSERLADVMAKYADVIKLGVFGHSHMDEMRLFGGEPESEGAKGKVAIKMVSSITPLASGVPSFTVAKVDTETAQMVDYTVYSGSNASGVNEVWKKRYSYGSTYHQTVFSAAALNELMERFEADPEVQDSASGAYLRNVIAGEKGLLLRGFWPEYSCVLEHNTVKGFAACTCPAK